MPSQFVHVVGIENDVAANPHEFLESLCEGIDDHLIACGIDGGISSDTPDGVAAPL